MTAYAIISLVCAVAVLPPAFLVPRFRKAGFVLGGAFLIVALVLFGIDCAISCVRTGELYVPKR
jgi:hypothetical protein